jgi:hypothetical protein
MRDDLPPYWASTATTDRPDHTELGYRRFRCRDCKRVFNERTGTLFNRLPYPTDIVSLVVLWRFRYKLSVRNLAEMFLQQGLIFTHEAVRDWESKRAPLLSETLRKRRHGAVARCCAGSRAPLRRTRWHGPSRMEIERPSLPPSRPALCRSRRESAPLMYSVL